MFTLGIPHKQYRRATSVLGNERNSPIEHETKDQGDGFYVFTFPNIDERGFKKIVLLLKSNGITTIGADDKLTEKKIMKLSNLIKEIEGPEPEAGDIISELEGILKTWETKKYASDKDRWQEYARDIQNLLNKFEDQEENFYLNYDLPETSQNITERKIRKFIQNEIKKFN